MRKTTNNQKRLSVLMSVVLALTSSFSSFIVNVPVAHAATLSNTSLDFDLADEANFTQEDTAQTAFTSGGTLALGNTTAYGGLTAAAQRFGTAAYSVVIDDLSVPATGVITSWRINALETTSLKLKAYLKNSPGNYTLRGNSSLESVVASTINGPFSTSIPVVAGDKIGMYGALISYTSTGGSGFSGYTSGDFTGTGAMSDAGANIRFPNLEYSLFTAPTSQAYYVTTANASQLKTKHWSAINSIAVTQTTPASTSIKYLVSFDGRSTWKYWTGSAWAASSLANLQPDGMSKATLEGLSSANWSASGGFIAGTTPSIDLAIDLASTDATATPYVDQITFSFDGSADTTLDYDLADEGNYSQQDASKTDFAAGAVALTYTSYGAQVDQTATMTGYSTPSPNVVSASSDCCGELAWEAFDKVDETASDWFAFGQSGEKWLRYDFGSGNEKTIGRITIKPGLIGSGQYGVKDWLFYGSNDGSSYTQLTSGTHANDNALTTHDFANTTAYRYYKITVTDSYYTTTSALIRELQLMPPSSSYPTNTGYYVATSNANQINTSTWTMLGRVGFTQTVPASTTLKHLVSFDGRSTWKYWNGSSFSTSTLGNIGTNGNTASTLESLGVDEWAAAGGFVAGSTTTLDFATELKTADAAATPSLSGITVEYSTVSAVPTNDATTNNSIVLSRLKAGEVATVAITYTLTNTISGTLTVTLPADFTINSAATGGSACLGTFGFDNALHVLTAEKTACSGTVTMTGATVTNPSSPGLYIITWTNDDPGFGAVYIVDSDQVTVTANVNSSISFDIDTSQTDEETVAAYTVALGVITTANGKVSGTTDAINYIWLDLDTNASSGAIVTVSSTNAALKSTSVPGDTIPSATAVMANGTANYGICVVANTAATGTFTKVSPYASTCAGNSETNSVGGVTVSPQTILNSTGDPLATGRAQIAVNAAISNVTNAHNDYSDTLKFIATGTF